MSRLSPEIKSRHSLAAKYVTEEIWNRLCDHKTETCGFTLEQVSSISKQLSRGVPEKFCFYLIKVPMVAEFFPK